MGALRAARAQAPKLVDGRKEFFSATVKRFASNTPIGNPPQTIAVRFGGVLPVCVSLLLPAAAVAASRGNEDLRPLDVGKTKDISKIACVEAINVRPFQQVEATLTAE
jgi:hypothetical protein